MKNLSTLTILLSIIFSQRAVAQNQNLFPLQAGRSTTYLLDSIITWEFDSATLHYDKPFYAQRYTYDAQNIETIFWEQNWDSSKWVNSFLDSFYYNEFNLVTTEVHKTWDTTWKTTTITFNDYNGQNENDSSYIDYYIQGSLSPELAFHNTFDYYGFLVTSEAWAYNQGWNYSTYDSIDYNVNYKITSELEYTWASSMFQYADLQTYLYDDQNNNATEYIQKWNYSGWDTIAQLSNTFDVNNNEITSIRYNVNIPDFNIAGPNDSSQYYYHAAVAGINNISNVGSISVYPNPAGSTVNISFINPVATPLTITLYDMTGRALLTQPVTANPDRLNVSNLAAGVYEVLVTDDEGDRTVRPVVVR